MRTSAFSTLKPPVLQRLEKEGFLEASPIQELAIPAILSGENVLLIAPTGTGKTLAAILPVLDRLIEARAERKPRGISVLYVTPLRALNRDLLRRLEDMGKDLDIKIQVRHGDTPISARTRQAKSPPDVMITTPETLQAILIGRRMKEHLRSVRWVVVDEVHELATDERGVQLSFALERLTELTGVEFQRIGLSATIGEPERIGQFLVGSGRRVTVLRSDETRGLQISVRSVHPSSGDQKESVNLGLPASTVSRARMILGIIQSHRSTLVFTNTREHAEALASQIQAIGTGVPLRVHHGSLSRELREEAEKEFQEGKLKALICTSSLELGRVIAQLDELRLLRKFDQFLTARNPKAIQYYFTNLSVIPDVQKYTVFDFFRKRRIGSLDQDFVARRCASGTEFILHGQTWKVLSVDEEQYHVEVEAAPPSLTAIPGWEGDMIPVQIDVAEEVGRARRLLSDGIVPDGFLEQGEVDRVESTLSAQKRQAPIPSDQLVLVESFENSVVVHSCFGNLVNETLATAMAALFGSRLGSNIGTQVDQYRFALIFPRPVRALLVSEEFRKLSADDMEKIVRDTIDASDLFAWRHWHVLRRLGAVSREAEYKARQARLLVDIFKTSIANDETRRELFTEKLDFKGARTVLERIGSGEISIETIKDVGQCTPFALPILDRIVPHGLLRPAVGEASIIGVVRSRLLSPNLRLLCINCGDCDTVRGVDTLREVVRCPKCRSSLIAATYRSNDALGPIINKKKRGRKLSPEEEKEWMTAWRSAGLIQNYGKRAGIVLAARGVGPTTATRILRNRLAREDDLYLSVLRAEREFERTRMFWD